MNLLKWKGNKKLPVLLCLCILFQSMAMPGLIAQASERGVCTANMLMIRTGPGTEYDSVLVSGEEAYLTKNQLVEILDSKNGWYHIKTEFRGKEVTGYSLAVYIQATADTGTTESAKGICTANTLMVRKGPGLTYDKVEVNGAEAYLSKGQSVEILEEKNGWYHIKATFLNTQIDGYSSAEYITKTEVKDPTPTPTAKPSKAPTPTPSSGKDPAAPSQAPGFELKVSGKVTASELEIWEKAEESSDSLALLLYDASITVSGTTETEDGRWYYVTGQQEGKNISGYADSTHIQLELGDGIYAKLKEESIIPVTFAGGNSPVLLEDGSELILQAEEVLLIEEQNVNDGKWFQIETTVSGKKYTGYIRAEKAELLGKKTDAASTPAPTPTPVPAVDYEMQLKLSAKVTGSTLNVRKDAGTSHEIVASLKKNDSVTIVGRKQNGTEYWYQINAKAGGKTISGYVLSDYIAITFGSGFYGRLTNTKTVLLESPGSSKQVTLAGGAKLELSPRQVWISEEKTVGGKKWFRIGVTISGTDYRGYVTADQVELLGKKVATTPSTDPEPPEGDSLAVAAAVNASTLNLRSKATTSSEKLATLTKNMKVTVLGEEDTKDGTWYQIQATVNKKKLTGYVLGLYITLDYSSPVYGVLTGNGIRPKVSAAQNASYVKNKDKNIISLEQGTGITLKGEETIVQEKWFLAEFQKDGETYQGYLPASEIDLKAKLSLPTPSPSPTPMPTPTPTPSPTPTPTPSPTPTPIPAPVLTTTKAVIKNAKALIVRSEPGYFGGVVCDSNNSPILLSSGYGVTLTDVVRSDDMLWYRVQFSLNSGTYTGYIAEEFLELQADNGTGTVTPGITPTPIPTQPPVIDNKDFEAKLAAQGFPESYKRLLRQLHQKYPNWEFQAYHTGLDWDTAVANESIPGNNLIPNSKGIEWKSLENGAYNWKTDSFIVYDGSTWVTASKEATAYYMDPRNFLDEKSIFQFEVLTYEPAYQNLAGVEDILQYTPMYQTSYTYQDETGIMKSISYAETFLRAAEYSKVSPYHLASRVKQEVVTGSTTMSSSVSGTFTGYEGYYNFYNIGAYHSTAAGGAIANGLKYAKNGSTNATLNLNSLIPWTNPYRAIVGGAYIIGNSYISRGQDTIYLQKFNVTPTSTYSHQYMANVEAPYSEGRKVYAAYTNVANLPIVFSIPVYLNMSEIPAPIPETKLNPNNWLKTLKVFDLSGAELVLTPTFDMTLEQEYYLVVDNSCDVIQIAADTVSKKAVVSGTSYYNLVVGMNQISVFVVAENGDTRQYRLNIVREEAGQ